MKKEDLKKGSKPSIHLQNNLVSDTNQKQKTSKVVSELSYNPSQPQNYATNKLIEIF